MNDNPTLVAIGLGIAFALFLSYRLARWTGRQRTLGAADRIAASLSTEHALMQAGRALRSKLECYRLAKVRANLGTSTALHAAAAELVREHRLHALERQ
jgi:hypothetical protein